MKTVKEFKDLGVEFVSGDIVFATEGCDVNVKNIFISLVLHAEVKSFAWRPLNTRPDNPRFKYELDGYMPQWRPLLDQSSPSKPYDFDEHVSEAKPVFTQEMMDDCSPLLAGMLFESECGQYEALMVNKRSVCFEDENGWLVTMPVGKVKPIRTPKQKAVDDIIKVLHSEGVVEFDLIMLYIMYEKGFIKC